MPEPESPPFANPAKDGPPSCRCLSRASADRATSPLIEGKNRLTHPSQAPNAMRFSRSASRSHRAWLQALVGPARSGNPTGGRQEIIRDVAANLPLMLAAFQDVANGGDSVPIARGGGHTEILLDDFIGIHQRSSQPPVDTQGESAGDLYDLHLPRLASRLADGKGRQCPRAFRQNAYETAHALAGRLIRKWFPGREVDDIARLTDHELRFERQSAEQFGAHHRLADRLADHKGSRRAHVDHIEVRQLSGQDARLERFVSSHIDASQEHDQGHRLPPTA